MNCIIKELLMQGDAATERYNAALGCANKGGTITTNFEKAAAHITNTTEMCQRDGAKSKTATASRCARAKMRDCYCY